MNSSYRRRPCHDPKPGFTLTELLVAFVIIISIIALSLTRITKMRQTADRIKASGNLSQLQIASTGYSTENNGQYVPIWEFDEERRNTSWWFNNPRFLSYLADQSSIDHRPDLALSLSMMDPVTAKARKKLYDRIFASFGYNETGIPGSSYGAPGNKPSFRTGQLTAPQKSAAFITATDVVVHYRSRFLWDDVTHAVEGKTENQKIAYRHNGKALVAFYDGHVGEVSMQEIRRFDTEGGATHIFWKADAP
jgi:prepilin-type processing-associated H-X9-DG protein